MGIVIQINMPFYTKESSASGHSNVVSSLLPNVCVCQFCKVDPTCTSGTKQFGVAKCEVEFSYNGKVTPGSCFIFSSQ